MNVGKFYKKLNIYIKTEINNNYLIQKYSINENHNILLYSYFFKFKFEF